MKLLLQTLPVKIRPLPIRRLPLPLPTVLCSASFSSTGVFSDGNRKHAVHQLGQKLWGQPLPHGVEIAAHAAVLVPLCLVDGVPSVILTLRSSKLAQNRGQVSFPGGKADAADRDITYTALRETWEEIGVAPRSVDVWAPMKPSPFPLLGRNSEKQGSVKLAPMMTLTPVVGFLGEIDVRKLHINHEEVGEVFTRSLESLCHPDNARFTQFRTGAGFTLPVYLGGDHKIWGATALILHSVLHAVLPNTYMLRLKRPRVYKMPKSEKS